MDHRVSASGLRFGQNNCLTEMCSGSEEGSYVRFMTFVSLDSRLESDKEEEDGEEFDLL